MKSFPLENPDPDLAGSTILRDSERNLARHGGKNPFAFQRLEEQAGQMRRQEMSLSELKASLLQKKRSLLESVGVLEAKCMKVDWANCELAPKRVSGESPDVFLLPPTPSTTRTGQSQEGAATPEIISKLKLLTPLHLRKRSSAETPSASPLNSGPHLSADSNSRSEALGESPVSSGITRLFPRKITPDQSPLLRASLLQSAMRRTTTNLSYDDSLTTSATAGGADIRASEAKNPLESFSPVMCSTMQHFKREDMRSLTEDEGDEVSIAAEVSPGLSPPRPIPEGEETKIQMYRRILASARGSQEQRLSSRHPTPEPAGTDLLSAAWGQVLPNLSPRTSPNNTSLNYRTNSSVLSDSSLSTPMCTEAAINMERNVNSRIDKLIEALTLSDSGDDLTLAGISFDGDDLMLSPHVP